MTGLDPSMIGGMSKFVLASIDLAAFSCPHCGAFTTQTWYDLHADRIDNPQRTPVRWDLERRNKLYESERLETEVKLGMMLLIDRIMRGQPFIEVDSSRSLREAVYNIHLSKCFNCEQIAVWVNDRMVFPEQREGVAPNPDLPTDLTEDFNEARTIVSSSPRGAAALLRLVIQKLCGHLGEKGRKIDDDIAALVGKGLNPMVQQALDAVRVIGNDAVHPGALDLKDDRKTALQLFELVNMIATQMISNPKAVDALYRMLPDEKRDAIDKRNEKALNRKGAAKTGETDEPRAGD